ncbi:unnamed protein product, partial [Meganyctiphanes norvegica]
MEGLGDEINPRSKTFNPEKLLSTDCSNVSDETDDQYEDLNEFRNVVHSQKFNVERDLQGVLGPGGIPVKKVAADTTRKFNEDQGLIQGRGVTVRNVLTRMEAQKGPLQQLKVAKDTNRRVKVYTRNDQEVRGVLTGYVIAWDKHWNMVLKDVDEVFQKKIKCKTPVPALGDVSGFVCLEDLTIREKFTSKGFEVDSDSDNQDNSNLEKQKEAGKGPAVIKPESSSSEMEERTIGRRLRRSAPGTSDDKDAKTLTLSQISAKDLTVGQKEEATSQENGKRRRKRNKRELRKRHVSQLLIRGENVVLVALL